MNSNRDRAESHIQRSDHFARSETSSDSDADPDQFWSRVNKVGAQGCWLWTGSRTTGRRGAKWYGYLTISGFGSVYTHRYSYLIHRGAIPDGLQVLHKCDVPACVNPDHLFIGTHLDNMQDAARKGRLHVPRPGRQTITDAQIAEMHTLRRAGWRQVQIAARFGVSKAFVSLLFKGKRRAA